MLIHLNIYLPLFFLTPPPPWLSGSLALWPGSIRTLTHRLTVSLSADAAAALHIAAGVEAYCRKTHTCTHARTPARTRTHTHTYVCCAMLQAIIHWHHYRPSAAVLSEELKKMNGPQDISNYQVEKERKTALLFFVFFCLMRSTVVFFYFFLKPWFEFQSSLNMATCAGHCGIILHFSAITVLSKWL